MQKAFVNCNVQMLLLHVNYPLGPEYEYRVPWNVRNHPVRSSQGTNDSFTVFTSLFPSLKDYSSVSFSGDMDLPRFLLLRRLA